MDVCVSLSRLLPSYIENPECVVVVDVVRSGTTAATAIANGAVEVMLFRTVEQTLAEAGKREKGTYVLGGERGSDRIKGFDCGNSPFEYPASVVGGKTLLMSTSNGPAAFDKYRKAPHVLYAAWATAKATAERVRRLAPSSVLIVCAGTLGLYSAEDAVCVGRLLKLLEPVNELDDGCHCANMAFERWGTDDMFLEALPRMEGGRRLTTKGMERDFVPCTTSDAFDFALEYEAELNRFMPVRER
ncbi:MAG: 2-phosphosulfolactate phosphatase [Planctomycetota bacterium]|nr:2-phosphosulfolactate phosphatase [Planctomycetota bacterium]